MAASSFISCVSTISLYVCRMCDDFLLSDILDVEFSPPPWQCMHSQFIYYAIFVSQKYTKKKTIVGDEIENL